jgi:2-amino-4-hydroxy-6-hydroxymethyldihydropteridine diphosphokinase
MIHTVYLGLGTNIGDRAVNLEAARLALEPEVHVQVASSIYETTPWGTHQPVLNQVLSAKPPWSRLIVFINARARAGRQPNFRWARIIDIDVVLDDLVLSQPGERSHRVSKSEPSYWSPSRAWPGALNRDARSQTCCRRSDFGCAFPGEPGSSF